MTQRRRVLLLLASVSYITRAARRTMKACRRPRRISPDPFTLRGRKFLMGRGQCVAIAMLRPAFRVENRPDANPVRGSRETLAVRPLSGDAVEAGGERRFISSTTGTGHCWRAQQTDRRSAAGTLPEPAH